MIPLTVARVIQINNDSGEISWLKEQNAVLMARGNPLQGVGLPPPAPPQHDWHITQNDLISILDVPNIQEQDIAAVFRAKEALPAVECASAQQQVTSLQFREWLLSPRSSELLVHGSSTETQYISGQSLFCAVLLRALQQAVTQPAALAFFCAAHLGDGDDNDLHTGGAGMIRNLLAQLLRQRTFDPTRLAAAGVNLTAVRADDAAHTAGLLGALVAQLAAADVLFCVVDGVRYYERARYVDGMGLVLRALLDMTRDPGVRCVVKVLVTSPSPTTIVRHAFEPECILSVQELPAGREFSVTQLSRQLRGELDG